MGTIKVNKGPTGIVDFKLRDLLSQIMHQEYINEWLNTPNPAFEDRTPWEVWHSKDKYRIYQMVYQILDNVAN